MNSGTFKLFKGTALIAVLLLVMVAFMPSWVQGHAGCKGVYSSTIKTIDSTSTKVLTSVTIALGSANYHQCVVTASATLHNSSSLAGGIWHFGLNRNSSSSLASGTDRSVELRPYPNDQGGASVSTNIVFSNVTGTNTFYFLGKKNQTSDPNATVSWPSISVACFDSQAW